MESKLAVSCQENPVSEQEINHIVRWMTDSRQHKLVREHFINSYRSLACAIEHTKGRLRVFVEQPEDSA